MSVLASKVRGTQNNLRRVSKCGKTTYFYVQVGYLQELGSLCVLHFEILEEITSANEFYCKTKSKTCSLSTT